MKYIDDKSMIDVDKLSLLRIKLILECGEIIHNKDIGPDVLINSEFIKNIRTSYLLENSKIKEENGKKLHVYEYDEYKKSKLVKEIEKILDGDLSALDCINENIFLEKEKKYLNEIISSIKLMKPSDNMNIKKLELNRKENINEK